MKNILRLILPLGILLPRFSVSQSILMTDTNQSTHIQSFQIYGSDIFVIGTQIERPSKVNKSRSNYDNFHWNNLWTSLAFYNSKTKELEYALRNSIHLISALNGPLYDSRNTFERPVSSMTAEYIFLLIQTDHNKDGILEASEPIFLYILTKKGTNLTQISPAGVNVLGYTLTQDQKTLLLRGQKDSNKDMLYENEAEALYQVKLDQDFSKITSFEIKLK